MPTWYIINLFQNVTNIKKSLNIFIEKNSYISRRSHFKLYCFRVKCILLYFSCCPFYTELTPRTINSNTVWKMLLYVKIKEFVFDLSQCGKICFMFILLYQESWFVYIIHEYVLS